MLFGSSKRSSKLLNIGKIKAGEGHLRRSTRPDVPVALMD
jgi:hypothetical protein